MRFFVQSRIDPQRNVYVHFDKQVTRRADIPEYFSINDINGAQQTYHRREVRAEVGPEPVGVALVVGALLFIIDPILGILGALGGGILSTQSEEERVRVFNSS
ncbi:MAG TPA: hypothetical protein VL944_02250 [Candidatus Acidoferrum sp.]|nr:hypothetical protein [Candidatus Acidoferrum sp.]